MVVIRRPMNAPRLNAIKTHCPRGHEYTTENTQWSVNPTHGGKTRSCVQCRRDREKSRRENKRALALSSPERNKGA